NNVFRKKSLHVHCFYVSFNEVGLKRTIRRAELQRRFHNITARLKQVLSKQFASVFTTENVENIPTPGSNFTPAIGNIVITVKGVEKQLASLDAKKASGPDGIPPWFLKENASQIAPILTDIYQESVSSGSLPGKWKEANVCAVFKKGKKCDPGNYRPISLTCIASKVLEHIVHSHLMKHMGVPEGKI
ncbi:Hypothetical predicted protein, partial [Paramuricea clavata]